jgi:hypothetical protein
MVGIGWQSDGGTPLTMRDEEAKLPFPVEAARPKWEESSKFCRGRNAVFAGGA